MSDVERRDESRMGMQEAYRRGWKAYDPDERHSYREYRHKKYGVVVRSAERNYRLTYYAHPKGSTTTAECATAYDAVLYCEREAVSA